MEKCDKCVVDNYGYEGIEKVIDIISGKWKLRILYIISISECIRYGELKRVIGKISHKMLAQQLRELEKDGLVIRIEYQEMPLKVEYMLSKIGFGLIPVYEEFGKWITENFQELKI